MNKLYILLFLSSLAFALTGCVTIKQAEIREASFNTSVWKSNAGDSNAIEQATDANANLPIR